MICLISSDDYFSAYGGGQVYVRHLARGLKAREKVCVISITSKKGGSQAPKQRKDKDIVVWQLQVDDRSSEADLPQELQPEVLQSLQELLQKIEPTLVHAHGWKATTSRVCKQLGLPCVVTAHHGGIVCPNGTLMNQHDQICQKPVSCDNCLECTLHTTPGGRVWGPLIKSLPETIALSIGKRLREVRNIPYTSPSLTQPLSIAHKLAFIEVLKTCPDAIVAPSNAIAESLIRNDVQVESVAVIPHGIPLHERLPLKPGLGNRPMRFIYVGRLSRVKGLHVMLEAFSGLTDRAVELHFVGGAANKSESRYERSLQRRYGHINASWHGIQPAEQVRELIQHCDVMVHPAICLEVFGLTIAEAMAAGRPVIASRCGGAEMQIQDGENGWLVPPNDAEGLRRLIERLINSPAKVENMANRLGKVNDLEQHANDIVDLYQWVLERRRAQAML